MELEIETSDRSLRFELVKPGQVAATPTPPIAIPGGATLRLTKWFERRALDVPTVLQFIVDLSVDVDVGLLAAWIYDKFKGRATRLRIDREVVEIEEGQIRRIVSERITAERR